MHDIRNCKSVVYKSNKRWLGVDFSLQIAGQKIHVSQKFDYEMAASLRRYRFYQGKIWRRLGWLAGWLACLAGWLAGWLAGGRVFSFNS